MPLPEEKKDGPQPGRRPFQRPAAGSPEQPPAPRAAPPPRQGPASTPTTAAPDTLKTDIEALASRVTSLQSAAQLTGVYSAAKEIRASVTALPGAIQNLRSRGYLYSGSLESQVQSLSRQWESVETGLLRQAQTESQRLGRQAASVAGQVQGLQATFQRAPGMARPLYTSTAAAVEALESGIHTSESRLQVLYNSLQQQAYGLETQVEGLGKMLKTFEAATFQLQAGESAVDTTPATYLREPDEGPEGFLYLTGQRLLFEQKEEVAKKKVLFIATEKELVHRLLLEKPIGYVEQAEGSEKGAIFHKEMLTVRFRADSGAGTARFQLKDDSAAWQALIRRVASGEIEQDRVGIRGDEASERAEAEAAAVRRLPTVCPTCGAQLPALVRGLHTLQCEYCGASIRV